MDLLADLTLATTLGRKAAEAIFEVRHSARSSPSQKGDHSPVTAADLAADAVLRHGLCATGDVVVTEESWTQVSMPTRGRVWVVDPLDGTEDFLRGRADYVVQVALVIDGKLRLGIVVQPETRIVWRGLVDDVLRLCERIEPDGATTALSLSSLGRLPGAPRIAASVSHPSAFVDFVVNEVGGVLVPRGSVGLKAAMVLEGQADAYVTASRRIKVWDTAAPAALIMAGGGVASDLSGRPLTYDRHVAHDDGVCLWSEPARAALQGRLQAAIARYDGTT